MSGFLGAHSIINGQDHGTEGLIRPGKKKKKNLHSTTTDKKAAASPPKSVPGNSKKVGLVNIYSLCFPSILLSPKPSHSDDVKSNLATSNKDEDVHS